MDSATYYLKECNSGYFFEWNYLAQTNISLTLTGQKFLQVTGKQVKKAIDMCKSPAHLTL
jgi:hypothetical protein